MEKITSRRNSLCLHVKKLGSDREYRYANSEFLCDGIKLLKEALTAGTIIKTVLTANLLNINLSDRIKIVYTTQDIINSISPLKNPQDVLFVCEMPDCEMQEYETGTYILLDSIQDPGNLGTIIRSADAFGMSGVMLTGACADPYNPKTIRASMGSIFRQKIMRTDISELSKSGLSITGAALSENCVNISDINLKNKIIAVGSEGSGLSDEVLGLCKEIITIPISDSCESLNAAIAASIIMWEVKRCRH